MKAYIYNKVKSEAWHISLTGLSFACVMLVMTALISCSADEPDTSISVITVDKVDYTPFDYWLQRNYVQPYNITFKYRYEDNESDMNYYTIPARYDLAIKLAHIVKYVCIEAYDEVGGIDFTRAYFPKMIFTIGEWEYRNNGTYILGTAEGGRKILLSGVNYLGQYVKDTDALNTFYLQTIHHEFTHILNQTVNYPADFQLISGTNYVADKWSQSPFTEGYLQRGFISAYSQHSHVEDFAELLCNYVCNSEEQWQHWMSQAGSEGERIISSKMEIVKTYMVEAFGVDLELLRSAIQRRQKDLKRGLIDLDDISVN